MAIDFACPHCGEQMTVDDKYAGTSGPCRKCDRTITIPNSVAMADAGQLGSPLPSQPKSSKSAGPIVVILVAVFFVVLVCGGVLIALLLPAVNAAREAARRTACQNNVRNIALAIANYEATHQELPPAFSTDENGQPLHSWRVLILPYLGENGLYNSLDLTKPWDDPVNLNITKTYMPAIYRCPSSPSATSTDTNYMVVSDPGSAFPDDGRARKFSEITDGLSRTIGVVETNSTPAFWSSPQDVTMSNLTTGSGHPGGFTASMLDGAVLFISTTTPITSMVIIDDNQ